MSPIILFIGKVMDSEHSKEELEIVIQELRDALTEIYTHGIGGFQAGVAVAALNKTDHVIIDKYKSKLILEILEFLVKMGPKQQQHLLNTLRK